MAGNKNLIVNGDFSRGNKDFTSSYHYLKPNPAHQTGQGDYSVVTNPGTQFSNSFDSYGDHTSGSGNMLLVDGTGSGAFWSQAVSLAADTTYEFTYFVTAADTASPAQVALSLNGATVDGGYKVVAAGGGSNWERVTASFTTTAAGSFTLALSDVNATAVGNDFTVDDISLRRAPVAFPKDGNLLKNGNFSKGDKGFATDYQHINGGTGISSTVDQYSVIANPGTAFTNGYDQYGDHTNGSGMMLFVDGTSSGAFWRESVKLAANTTYQFSYYVTGADNSNLPSVRFALNGTTVDAGFQVSSDGGGAHWQHVVESFTTTSAGAYILALSDNGGAGEGNDFTLDDFVLRAASAAPGASLPMTQAAAGGHERFAFHALTDAPQTIDHLADSDAIKLRGIDANAELKGHQAFVLVGALDGHAGEAALSYDSGHDVTRLLLDVDGDGRADMTVNIVGDHRDFHHFIL